MMNTELNDYLLSVLDKAESGRIVESGEFDQKFIFEKIKHLIDKYDLRWDRETYVPSDDDLADRVYAAGYELALDTGVYCLDTQRRMIWAEEELNWILENAPSEVTLGMEADRAIIRKRDPESNNPITIAAGAIGIPVPEELFVPLMVSIAQERQIDIIDNASLLKSTDCRRGIQFLCLNNLSVASNEVNP